MSELSLRCLQKSDFGGTRSGTRKRKPNQLYVCDKISQWLDLPRDMYFNELPVQLILEIFKYLLAYELLRQVSLEQGSLDFNHMEWDSEDTRIPPTTNEVPST
ncbi:hypothetical protein CHS0354_029771 [Potamilus streckersoni]|uniref:Uncharacterized protein n=1 Tax=Potamilus streckersoni TaxID=2493646 RepID=A0AAE0WED6_9BIVA|nr:hypothetical protein CHS0354_029771 [Potamilus streckersoni]